MHLKQTSNSYNSFILQKIEEEKMLLLENQPFAIEAYHIIPKSLGGPDESWNLVCLTKEDHFLAHYLRFEVYKHPGDKAALNFRLEPSLTTKEVVLKRIHLSHQSAKNNQSGFFSSEQQFKNGKKGGAKQTENKRQKYAEKISPITSEKMKNGLIWTHHELEHNLIVPPNSISLIIELLPIFRQSLPTNSVYTEKFKNVSNASFTSSISKVLLKKRQFYLGFKLID
jgi:hypothetical protein